MAAGNFAQALALVLVHEGGKSDDPHDPGGRTNWGITHIDYDAYRRSKGLPLQDVYLMTDVERDDIYRSMYWDPIRGDDLPSGLDYVVFDGGVNSGIAQSIKWLQRAVPSLPANGRVSQALVTAATQVSDPATLIEACCEARREFLQSLSTFQYFGKGWMKRVNDVQATALTWLGGAAPPLPASAATTSQPKALRESAAPLPSTAPGDAASAATGVGIAAAVAAHAVTTPAAPAGAPSTTVATNAPPPATPPAGPSMPPAPAPASSPAAPASTPPAQLPSAPVQSATPSPAVANAPAAPPSMPPSPPVSGAPTVTPVAGTTQPASAPAAATKLLPPATAPGTTPVQSAPAKPAVAGPTVNSSAPTLLNPPTKAATPPQAVAAPPPQAAPGTTVPAQPSQRIIGINDSFYPATLIALGILLLIGLYFSFSSRSARTRRSDALGDNPYPKTPLKIGKVVIPAPPKPAAKAPPPRTPAAAVVAGVEQIPLVRNIYAQTASVLWIFATIVVNVIALASLLQQFGFARENWHQPFVWLGSLYSGYATQAFNLTATSVNQQFGLKLPSLLLPIFVLYVSSASAFVVASSGLMRRNTSGESLFAAVIHAGWIFAVPAFVLDAIRYRVVTTFARQNTVLFFGYIAALGIAYIAARFINDDILPGFLQQYGAAAASAVSKGAAAATVLTNELRQ